MTNICRSLSVAGCMLMLSCDHASGVYSEYRALEDAWPKGKAVEFAFEAPDTTQVYDMFINLRNDERYPFSNLYLIVNLDFPDGRVIADTLEYEMAAPDGTWLGRGFTDLKENRLWYKESVVFPVPGTYAVGIEQAMRKVGEEEGLEELEGITDVGLQIEKAE
ncbi:gliding motility lipoprotein GldH [Sinomicrobium soli]|uniref:gliding motility lipoprotein GldH n=1 Tax=Sinomicrobium sp. N-1-3-6 TaxID=2219864 RepID=UPI000DCD847F|nr:gliding motility lipoprotein GldH [Sinomicrobium sp. N-1-3-6]RAV28288.1 gliding motility lipoprotein GldH [Sinomicrobium sp. N-1-3-6]